MRDRRLQQRRLLVAGKVGGEVGEQILDVLRGRGHESSRARVHATDPVLLGAHYSGPRLVPRPGQQRPVDSHQILDPHRAGWVAGELERVVEGMDVAQDRASGGVVHLEPLALCRLASGQSAHVHPQTLDVRAGYRLGPQQEPSEGFEVG